MDGGRGGAAVLQSHQQPLALHRHALHTAARLRIFIFRHSHSHSLALTLASSQILRCDYCRSELYGVTVVPRLCRHMVSAEKLLTRVIMRIATQKIFWGNKCERTKLQVFIRSLQCFIFPIPRRDFQCPMHRGCPR